MTTAHGKDAVSPPYAEGKRVSELRHRAKASPNRPQNQPGTPAILLDLALGADIIVPIR